MIDANEEIKALRRRINELESEVEHYRLLISSISDDINNLRNTFNNVKGETDIMLNEIDALSLLCGMIGGDCG